ncbi:MAG: hypothetical protein UW43_C0009G0004 [Candidatus Yanofskybacteria bacterium GW2011_GWA1_44_21]|uniref:Uncharacterized protein n=2 Tax=Candidatus Yanofskyibacteriota TaxID=1752733 RepID=A0A1F8GZM4_9BACT|nr:MAG: hypothetical protein UW14_C0004G0020 [Candidatus Yanofskybacteria bacterium GW2011_GWA2_44_10]KKT50273.1 MAG: hypothetical protein UW43_C0009G0004 [Candidatus Yanofskybacteria bacterium GW2011_GWA1_44_21]KKT90308.1 MAG: hypothetical protein UW90_C0003G0032 [Candidatus Yanofskybacteria bacterium GW2011_GWB1_45_11]OGN03644.1 MAG: hypothetical protein A2657_01610 [Candidatus Yanofskybacteria bacterium RIFCSPHIGHO2_01_FULL_44_110b]OGN14536.1 MAG: hypothetical protein A3C01_00410 [Candidatus
MPREWNYSPPFVAKFVNQDVALVMHNAAVCIEVPAQLDGTVPVRVKINLNPKLNVIAVIGPGVGLPGTSAEGLAFLRVVLCEVGLWRTRPYQRSYNWRNGFCNHKRRKWFSLTPEQYSFVAPIIFEQILDKASDQMRNRKTSGYFTMRNPRRPKRTGRLRFSRPVMKIEVSRGVRFSMSFHDTHLTADIYARELISSINTGKIRGMAKYISRGLSRIKGNSQFEFTKTKTSWDLFLMFSKEKLSLNLNRKCLDFLGQYHRGRYGEDLQKILRTIHKRKYYDAMPNPLPGIEERLNGFDARVTSESRDCFTVEIHPHSLMTAQMDFISA